LEIPPTKLATQGTGPRRISLLFIVQIDFRNNTDRIAGAGRGGRLSAFGQKGEYPFSAGKDITFAGDAPVLLARRRLWVTGQLFSRKCVLYLKVYHKEGEDWLFGVNQ
jgi:hypothetical protein